MPLVAPFDGVIASVTATPGAYLAADQPIATLVDAHIAWVEGALFETDIAKVDVAADALVTLDGRAVTATPVSATR